MESSFVVVQYVRALWYPISKSRPISSYRSRCLHVEESMLTNPIIVKGEDIESDWRGCANAHNLRRWHIDCRPEEKARSYFMGLSCHFSQRRTCTTVPMRQSGRKEDMKKKQSRLSDAKVSLLG